MNMHRTHQGLSEQMLAEPVIRSEAMRRLFSRARRVAQTDEPVLILGETGTGKEVLARYIHQHSPRRDHPFLPLNCAAMPENLIESELFGYRKGAFTDARRDKKGLLEVAEAGTVFLDEIGELPMTLQAKLLRAIERQEILPLGGTEFIKTNFRLIAASNRDLFKEKDEGRFRADLFYRIGVFVLEIPPLRERLEEIPYLVDRFVQEVRPGLRPTPEFIERLMCHNWPGNVRELRNVIRHAALLAEGDVLDLDLLPDWLSSTCVAPQVLHHGSLKEKVRCFERTMLERYLEETGGNVEEALKRLGVSRSTFYRKLSRRNHDGR